MTASGKFEVADPRILPVHHCGTYRYGNLSFELHDTLPCSRANVFKLVLPPPMHVHIIFGKPLFIGVGTDINVDDIARILMPDANGFSMPVTQDIDTSCSDSENMSCLSDNSGDEYSVVSSSSCDE